MSSNLVLAIGLAVARHQLAQVLSSWGLVAPRQAGPVDRSSHWPENLAYLGTGLVVGGVAALLLAPASGQVTRAQLSRKAAEALAEVAAGSPDGST